MNLVGALLAALLVLVAHPTWDQLVRLRAEESRLVQSRTELSKSLDDKTRALDALKARAAGPVEQARLEAAMAEAQELARKLIALDGQLTAKRRAALAVADRIITEERDANLRAQAIQVRADMARALAAPASVGPPGVAAALGIRENATDGPEDLREKADLLKDTADKIQRELGVLDRKYGAAQRRMDLQRQLRSLESNVFAEDVRRQHALARETSTGGSDRVPSPAAGTPPPPTVGGDPISPTPPPSGGSSTAAPSSALSDVIVLKDVLDTATMVELAEPKDPAAYLRALERARQRLRALAADLDQRSQALRRRADELRKGH